MAMDFDKWNEEFGGADAVKQLKDAASNNGFEETPDGKYICSLAKLEMDETKTGKPMVKAQFKVIEGDKKKWSIFGNFVMTKGFPMHKTLQFLRSLKVFDDSEIDFDGNFKNFNELLLDIAENAEGMKFEVLKTTEGEWSRIEVTDVIG